MKSKLMVLFAALLVAVFCAQVLLMGTTAVVTALPPRPTAVPPQKSHHLPGGFIQLHVDGLTQPEHWTHIQWQDAAGAWHDVSGWQGTLTGDHTKKWYVGPENLDTGPFRWVVQAGDTLTHSAPFSLPAAAGETVTVTVALD